jgi:hypothetical protein
LLLALLLAGIPWRPAQAQAEVEVLNDDPIYAFNEFIQFSATIRSAKPIKEVLIFVGPEGADDLQVFPSGLEDPAVPDNQGRITYRLDLKQNPFRGFSTIEYRYEVTIENGETYSSPYYLLRYLDNRYEWQELESPPFRVYWFAGDVSFAQEVLNVAHAGEKRLPELLEVYLPEELNIYVYSSAAEMQIALLSPSQSWIAGHSDPDLGVILVSLPFGPDQRLEIERQIPHEMMHAALYYTDAHTYKNLPAWFNEGLASLAELYPSPEYQAILENAFRSGGLLSMASLCDAFPTDVNQLLLAYAQSASFTRYLFDHFGTGGFNRLRGAYAASLGCRQGVESALESSLEALESQWLRNTFAGDAWQEAVADLLPWTILLLVILVGPLIMLISAVRRHKAGPEL